MKKLILITFLISSSFFSFSQAPSWDLDENYIYTKLYDDFNDPTLPNWRPNFIYRGIGQLIDSSLTHRVQNGKLELTMAYLPNYNDSTNYVGQEFWTNEDFSFGIFECEASFANGLGSWPAFWAFSSATCINDDSPEIDFAEYFNEYTTSANRFGHFIHHWKCNNKPKEDTDYQHDYQFRASTNIYKCIWTPDKAEFYVDGIKKHTFYNNGQDWFPLQNMHVIVSQQIVKPWGYPGWKPTTPQTSYFNWVKVKQYFQPPVITLSSNTVCSSGSATLDVDSEALNINWSISPTNLFSGTTSGTGKNASFTASAASGEATITYSFEMPSGETFEAEETFWIGAPGMPTTNPSGYPTEQLSLNEIMTVYLTDSPDSTSGRTWWATGSLDLLSAPGNTAVFEAASTGTGNFYVTTQNTCGTSPTGGGTVNVTSGGGGMMMAMSPNPTSGETTLTLLNTTEEASQTATTTSTLSDAQTFDYDEEWELEIYDHLQSLKAKKTKIKGNKIKIKTQGWRDGVYFIRVKYKEELIQGKLVVKNE